MKFYFLFIALLLISGCTAIPFVKKNVQEGSISGKRGIVMQFLPEQPPLTLQEQEPFFLGINIENYLPAATPVIIDIVPSVQIPGAQRIDQNLVLQMDTATVDDKKLLHSGKILEPQDKLDAGGNLHLGPYSYILPYSDEEVQFFIEYSYPVEALLKGRICSSDPSLVKTVKCPGERLSESSFEGPAKFLPITITHIEKKMQGFSRESYQLALDFYLADQGAGDVTTGVTFLPDLEGNVPLLCKQDAIYGTSSTTGLSIADWLTGEATSAGAVTANTLQIQLQNGKAKVHCTAVLPSRETDAFDKKAMDTPGAIVDREISMSLAYTYRVQLRSQNMRVINLDE